VLEEDVQHSSTEFPKLWKLLHDLAGDDMGATADGGKRHCLLDDRHCNGILSKKAVWHEFSLSGEVMVFFRDIDSRI
jgi:hypothetical protein